MANLTDQAIRASTVAALIAAGTSLGSRVFASRLNPNGTVDGDGEVQESAFPFALVYVLKERKRSASMSHSQYTVTTTVGIEVHALVAAGVPLVDDVLDDTLDPIRAEVEEALLASAWEEQFSIESVDTQIRLGKQGGGREVMALLSVDATHFKEYFRTLPESTLDTIVATVNTPTAADLTAVVDLT